MLAKGLCFFIFGQVDMMDFHVNSTKSRMDILQAFLFVVDVFLLKPWKASLQPFGLDY